MTEQDLEGRWDIVSWRQDYDDGRVVLPMSETVDGFLEYRAGRFVVMLAKGDRPHFTTGGQWDASVEEKARAYETGLFYAGTYRVEGDQVIHSVEIASVPDWTGSLQRRRLQSDGESLRLSARIEDGTPMARTAVLDWRRTH